MNENQAKQDNLLDTTDYLEAIGVLRGWKNFLFIIVVICLFLLQVSFWLVNTGYVKAGEEVEVEDKQTAPAAPKAAAEPNEVVTEQTAAEPDEIAEAAKRVAADANLLTEVAPQQPQQKRTGPIFRIKFGYLAWLVRFLDFVLILAAMLYCLTILFNLKVSLLGRLGGINHICRAFFLSLTFLVLLLPWQRFFGPVVKGAIYTPGELVRWYTVETTGGILGIIIYYLRFTGYWLLVMLLLILSQVRSVRWAKATLRRLEIV
jgi:hypothetical protein